MTTFDKEYKNLVERILTQGHEEFNQRTGLSTKILTGIHFNFRAEELPILTLRKIPLKLFIAEQIWYLQGVKELDFFQKFSKIWDDFKEEDSNCVDSGYGYRWRNFFQRDQITGLIAMFKKDPSSRHGVVMTWDPNTDGLASPKKKNVPCVPVWIANIVNGELNLHIIFRSQDVMLGLPHDVAGFALLQHILAQHLKVSVGWLHYSISHAHIYENHYKQAEELVRRTNDHNDIKLQLPENTYERAIKADETVVEEIFTNINSVYNPLPSLGKMQIAL